MAREVQRIDYVGFYFAGKHSSEFGLYSASNGDRYGLNLSPTIKDRTAENSGGMGMYFFGSQHTQRQFNLNLAFDDVTEEELRAIQVWLNSDVSELIFDERPYIKYYCKVSTTPTINYIPFNAIEDDNWLAKMETADITQGGVYGPSGSVGGRVYKGDISVVFTAYDPYGYSVSKKLGDFGTNKTGIYYCENKEEWQAASGLLGSTANNYDTFNGNTVKVYNGGSLDCDFILKFNVNSLVSPESFGISLTDKESIWLFLPAGAARTYTLDSKKRLLFYEETNGDKVIKKVANNAIASGDFFKIPRGYDGSISITGNVTKPFISYNYIYI